MSSAYGPDHIHPFPLTAENGKQLKSGAYVLLDADLAECESTDLVGKLRQNGWDDRQPTLFLAECLLLYLDPTVKDRLLGYLARNAAPGSRLIAFEPVLGPSAFARTMRENVASTQLEIHAEVSEAALTQRFTRAGWAEVELRTAWSKYQEVPSSELNRYVQWLNLVDWNGMGN